MKAAWVKMKMCAIYDCIARTTADTVLPKEPWFLEMYLHSLSVTPQRPNEIIEP